MAKGRSRKAAPAAPIAPGAPRRVLAYIRVSSAAQEEHGTSLDGQRTDVVRYCSSRGWPAPDVHVEVESGGSEKIERRRELRRLLDAVKPGDVVLVCKVDRWSRDIVYAVQSVRELIARGVGWISIGEGLDASTSNGDSQLGIMAWAADNERKKIRERTVLRRRALRADGAFVEGATPFGYKPDRKARTLIIDDVKGPIVRDIFARVIAGASTREIASAMTEEHPGVGGLDHAAICRKVRDRVYLGEMRPSARKGVRPRPGDPWLKDAHPAIVDRATWARANAAMGKRRLNGRPPGAVARSAGFLLRGLARCGECGFVLRAHHPGENSSVKHGGWYLCGNRTNGKRVQHPCPEGPIVRYAAVDAEVDALALAHFTSLAAKLGRAETPAHAPKVTTDFAAKRKRIAAARERVVDAVAANVFSLDMARAKIAALDSALEHLDREEDKHATPEPARPRREQLAEVKQLVRAWAAFDVADKREAIKLMADSITITAAGKLRIRWKRTS